MGAERLLLQTVMKKSRAKSHFFVVLFMFVDLLKVLSMFLCLLAVCLLSAGIGYVGSIGESFCFCFAVLNGQIGCCY